MTVQPQHILLVEDNDVDAELAALAFRRAKIVNPLVRVCDGVEALNYLFARGDYTNRTVGDTRAIVLLDLKLPKLSGQEVLVAIRADARTRHLPIVILSSSNEISDRAAAYEHFANSYVLKPVDFDQFVAAVLQLRLYWLVLNVPAPPTQ